MKLIEVVEEAERLRLELKSIPEPSMSNYKLVLAKYKRIVNDMVVLIREIAKGAQEHREV